MCSIDVAQLIEDDEDTVHQTGFHIYFYTRKVIVISGLLIVHVLVYMCATCRMHGAVYKHYVTPRSVDAGIILVVVAAVVVLFVAISVMVDLLVVVVVA